jgi:hypothetical protein
MWLLIATGFVGAGIGVVAFVALDRYLPLYSGEVLFEIRSGLDEASDVGSRDIAQEDLVTRLASTETVLLTSRDVLMAAVQEPDVQQTTWFKQKFVDPATRVALIDEAVDELPVRPEVVNRRADRRAGRVEHHRPEVPRPAVQPRRGRLRAEPPAVQRRAQSDQPPAR